MGKLPTPPALLLLLAVVCALTSANSSGVNIFIRQKNAIYRLMSATAKSDNSTALVEDTDDSTALVEDTEPLPVADPGMHDDWQPADNVFNIYPDPQKCAQRPQHWKYNNSWYAEMGKIPQFQQLNTITGRMQPKRYNWLAARNICRRYCMDAIGFETEEKWEMFRTRYSALEKQIVWTKGRICDFQGCTPMHPDALTFFGWVWPAQPSVALPPANQIPTGWREQPWAPGGHGDRPQPDNHEKDEAGTREQCLAVVKNKLFGPKAAWHDLLCGHEANVICEENQDLLEWAQTNRTDLNIITL